MSRAEDLFESINLEAVEAFVPDRQEEHLHLDFKTVADARLNRDDRKNLAEAVSGFANSDGGVIVWGVDARGGGRDGADVAQELKPTKQLALFMSRLTAAAGEAANPPPDGVIHRSIPLKSGPDEGYAVSLIPASDAGPHMAKLGQDRYFKRSGDRFVRMEHFDVEDMFGRRKRPVLRLLRSVSSGAHGSGGGVSFYEVLITLALENSGRGSATAPYLVLQGVGQPFFISPHGISVGGSPAHSDALMPPMADGRSFVAKSTFVLHPVLKYEVALLHGEIRDPVNAPNLLEQSPRGSLLTEFPELVITYGLGAENLRLQKGTLKISGEDLTRVALSRGSERLDWE